MQADERPFDYAKAHFAWASLSEPPPQHKVDKARGNLNWDDWKRRARDQIGCFLGVPHTEVRLFSNTTASVQRILQIIIQVLGRSQAKLLTTDFEYPGIIAAIDDCWPGPMFIAKLEEMIWSGRARDVPDALRRAFLLVRPDVVLVSHVSRGAGYVLPDESIAFMREVSPSIAIIIDGAQAVGNINISGSLLALCDFYVASSHKWLGGKTTLGFAIGKPPWILDDPSQSYTRPRGSAGTGDMDALVSFVVAMESFVRGGNPPESKMMDIACLTRELGDKFQEELLHLNSDLQSAGHLNTGWVGNGVIAVSGSPGTIGAAVTYIDHSISQEEPATCKMPRISLMDEEHWVDREDDQLRGPRYFVNRAQGHSPPRLDKLESLRHEVVPLARGGNYLRVSCHGLAHIDDDVKHLANCIREGLDNTGGGGP